MKFQCLSSENFLTLVTKMPPVFKNMKTKKKWFLKMMFCIHFPKKSWIIEFVTSACQSVTYWPSTQTSIREQVHPVEDITWLWTGWIRCKCDAHRKQMDVNDISRCDRKFSQLESVCCSSRQWEPDSAESWVLRPPGWAAKQNEKEVLLKME